MGFAKCCDFLQTGAMLYTTYWAIKPFRNEGNKCIKHRPNSRNISTQQIALLGHVVKELARRAQPFDATDHNIVGNNMLATFGHSIATCCKVLDAGARCVLICNRK